MIDGTGKLRSLRERLCPTWAALGAVVLLLFLALGSTHDHADDAPGTTAIHCPVVAGPVVEGTGADDLRIQVADAVAIVGVSPRPAPAGRRAPSSDRARAPPARVA